LIKRSLKSLGQIQCAKYPSVCLEIRAFLTYLLGSKLSPGPDLPRRYVGSSVGPYDPSGLQHTVMRIGSTANVWSFQ